MKEVDTKRIVSILATPSAIHSPAHPAGFIFTTPTVKQIRGKNKLGSEVLRSRGGIKKNENPSCLTPLSYLSLFHEMSRRE
jgi:hypothetical protein